MTAGPARWIGVDVGGTWVRAVPFSLEGAGPPRAVGETHALSWKPPAFRARPLAQQLAGAPPDADERAAAAALVAAIAETVDRALASFDSWQGNAADVSPPGLATDPPGTPPTETVADVAGVSCVAGVSTVQLALCSAGPKTADGRGIDHWLNGPRVPDLIGAVRATLEARSQGRIVCPQRVWDDQLAGATGELVAGAAMDLPPAAHGLYLGLGTGVAEAWLHGGRARRQPFTPAHELPDAGRSASNHTDDQAPDVGGPSFDATAGLRLADPKDPATLDAVWGAIGRLVEARAAAYLAAETPLTRVVIGGKGAELFATRSGELAGLEVRFSTLAQPQALGAVALERGD